MSRTDKLCLIALAGVFLTANLIVWAMDTAAYRAAEADKPAVEAVTIAEIDYVPLFEAAEAVEIVEAAEPDLYDETIPLDRECQTALREACEEYGVVLCDALGVIEVESGFQADANNGACVGLMQTNEKYASKFKEATGYSIYTAEGNIRGGVWYLGKLLERYDGDIQAALVAYNQGSYKGIVTDYARKVLAASEKWGCG